MAEWSNAAVLKTVDLNGSGGSNPSLSAEKWLTGNCEPLLNFSVTKSGSTQNFWLVKPYISYGDKITSEIVSHLQELTRTAGHSIVI